MKSYTDIEQSKKLAEFLPIESTDNVIVSFGSREGTKTVAMPKETLDVIKTPFSDIRETTMCWSLAALIELMPLEIKICKQQTDDIFIYYYIEFENRLTCLSSERHKELVDACVEMIIKLHEQKIL